MSRKTTQMKFGKYPWKHTVAGGPVSELIDDGEVMVFTVEENARDAPACGSRAASSQQTIATALEKLQPAL